MSRASELAEYERLLEESQRLRTEYERLSGEHAELTQRTEERYRELIALMRKGEELNDAIRRKHEELFTT